MALTECEPTVELVPMNQLAEVKNFWQDDWTGLADVRARRKRQNRLSKRARRRLKAANGGCSSPCSDQRDLLPTTSSAGPEKCKPKIFSRTDCLALFKSIVTSNISSPWTPPHLRFQLPADHLLTLIQFNTYRAMLTNMNLLLSMTSTSSLHQACDQPSRSSALTASPSHLTGTSVPITSAIPPSLAPTPLQRCTLHPSWIDSVPLAAMRDNLISEMGKYDPVALCVDTLGCLFHEHREDDYTNRKGIIVWSDPWNISSWELTEGFVRKYGFLLKGCEELIVSTNHWRAVRGEDALFTHGVPNADECRFDISV